MAAIDLDRWEKRVGSSAQLDMDATYAAIPDVIKELRALRELRATVEWFVGDNGNNIGEINALVDALERVEEKMK